jgi:hypothetical protein
MRQPTTKDGMRMKIDQSILGNRRVARVTFTVPVTI